MDPGKQSGSRSLAQAQIDQILLGNWEELYQSGRSLAFKQARGEASWFCEHQVCFLCLVRNRACFKLE